MYPTLGKLPKATTPQLVYQQKFLEFKNKYPTSTFICTDGTKISSSTSFSVVSNVISQQHLLPYYSSIFSAEIIAIYHAVLLAKHSPNSSVICSDSLLALNAIANPSNNFFYPATIRQILLKNINKISIIWIPGDCGIQGNEVADETAKNAFALPLTFCDNPNTFDMLKSIIIIINKIIKHIKKTL